MAYYTDTVLLVFCKAPIAGEVKTRLTPYLSPEQAAQLHKSLTLNTLNTVTQKPLCAIELWCSPTIQHAFFQYLAKKYDLNCRLQQGVDLGERMNHALTDALYRYKKAILMGCDSPSLSNHDLESAIMSLTEACHAVFAPTEDGGYVLVGLNQAYPELFTNMTWSHAKVMQQTRQRCQQYTIRYKELSTQWDVDTPNDVRRLIKNGFSINNDAT